MSGSSASIPGAGGSWWAPSRSRARGTVLGAVVLIGALVVTSVAVWTSPTASPVAGIARVTEAFTEYQRILEERNLLLGQLVDLKAELAQTQADLDARAAELDHAKTDLGQAQASLDSVSGQLTTAQKQLAKSQNRVDELNRTLAGTQASLKISQAQAAALRKALAAAGVPASQQPVTAPSKNSLVSPAAPYFGMYTQQSPFNWAELDATSTKIGALPNVAGYFQGWDGDFRPDAVRRSWQRGMLPLLTWESRPLSDGNDVVNRPEYSLAKIIRGDFDAYLHKYAKAVAANALPLAIRLDHEMNGNWYPWSEQVNGNSRGQYVQMWRHVHDIFQAEGANRYVIWVWAPNRIDTINTSLATMQSLYPGDAYVDWVGMSGYLRQPVTSSTDVSFAGTYGRTLQQLRAISSKPILLAEVGATEIGGRKVEWTRNFFEGINSASNRDIIGFAWFSEAVTSYTQGQRTTDDWRIDSRSDTLAAFKQGLLGAGSRFKLAKFP